MPNEMYAFGRVMRDAGIAIYKYIGNSVEDIPNTEEYQFVVSIYKDVLQGGKWTVVGNRPFNDEEESDIVYKATLNEQELIIYVLLEFQSSVDFSMPIRLLLYMVEIWRDILKNTPKEQRKTKNFKLPAILPIVLYNGTSQWTANRSFKECISGFELFGANVVDFEYNLLSVNDYSEEELLKTANLVSAIFLMDQNMEVSELKNKLKRLIKILQGTSEEQFEGFKKWLLYIIKSRMPQEDRAIIDQVIKEAKVKEVESMVYNLERTLDNLKQEGLEEGMKKGKQEGIKEGKYSVAKRLLMKGQDIETVMDVTELTREEIEKLVKEMN